MCMQPCTEPLTLHTINIAQHLLQQVANPKRDSLPRQLCQSTMPCPQERQGLPGGPPLLVLPESRVLRCSNTADRSCNPASTADLCI